MGRTLKLHALPDTQLVREVQRIYGGIPRELLVEPAMLMRMLPILRADLQVNETYRHVHEPPIGCSILALGGTQDPHVTGTELELWHSQTTERFDSAQFEGGHFYLTTPEGMAWVVGKISQAVAQLA
jgi:surfactin synthase thioesterase subunit